MRTDKCFSYGRFVGDFAFKAVSLCGTYDLQLDVFFEFKIVYFNLTSNADLVQIYFVLYNNFSILLR